MKYSRLTVVLLWESCLGNIDTNTQKISRRVPLVVQREEVYPCTFLCNYDKPPFPNFNHYTWQHGWPMFNGETFNWCFMGILAFVAHMLFLCLLGHRIIASITDYKHVTLWSIVVWVTHHGIWCCWNMQNDHQTKYVCHLDSLALIQRLMSKLVSTP